jgi:hypothetical protein
MTTETTDQEVARLKTTRTIATVLAIVTFLGLVVSFGLVLKPWYQVPAGLVAWACIEWQRRCGQRIKELTTAQSV